MARSRPSISKANARRMKISKRREPTSTELIAEATALLHTGDPDSALPLALRALVLSASHDGSPNTNAGKHNGNTAASLPALTMLAEINLELGDANSARAFFLQAVDQDPSGEIPEEEGGGADKFLWLAQLSEEGGKDSVRWFERGAAVLRRDIARAEESGIQVEAVEEKKRKLVGALCGIVEVYMTDLSLDSNAETICLSTISTALSLLPHSPQPHQTHASILISQSQPAAARAALRTALALWRALPTAHPDVPDFAARISLARLLLEVGMEEDALGVVGGCVEGDDACVEGWYLGGWGLFVLGEKRKMGQVDAIHADPQSTSEPIPAASTHPAADEYLSHWRASRDWLRTCLRLYDGLAYEDDRLRAHALELIAGIEAEFEARGEVLGDDDDDEWSGGGEGSEEEESSGGSGGERDERREDDADEDII